MSPTYSQGQSSYKNNPKFFQTMYSSQTNETFPNEINQMLDNKMKMNMTNKHQIESKYLGKDYADINSKVIVDSFIFGSENTRFPIQLNASHQKSTKDKQNTPLGDNRFTINANTDSFKAMSTRSNLNKNNNFTSTRGGQGRTAEDNFRNKNIYKTFDPAETLGQFKISLKNENNMLGSLNTDKPVSIKMDNAKSCRGLGQTGIGYNTYYGKRNTESGEFSLYNKDNADPEVEKNVEYALNSKFKKANLIIYKNQCEIKKTSDSNLVRKLNTLKNRKEQSLTQHDKIKQAKQSQFETWYKNDQLNMKYNGQMQKLRKKEFIDGKLKSYANDSLGKGVMKMSSIVGGDDVSGTNWASCKTDGYDNNDPNSEINKNIMKSKINDFSSNTGIKSARLEQNNQYNIEITHNNDNRPKQNQPRLNQNGPGSVIGVDNKPKEHQTANLNKKFSIKKQQGEIYQQEGENIVKCHPTDEKDEKTIAINIQCLNTEASQKLSSKTDPVEDKKGGGLGMKTRALDFSTLASEEQSKQIDTLNGLKNTQSQDYPPLSSEIRDILKKEAGLNMNEEDFADLKPFFKKEKFLKSQAASLCKSKEKINNKSQEKIHGYNRQQFDGKGGRPFNSYKEEMIRQKPLMGSMDKSCDDIPNDSSVRKNLWTNNNYRVILIVQIRPLFYHPHETLRYSYVQKPKPKKFLKNEETLAELKKFLDTIAAEMKLSDSYCYFYQKNGKRVNNIYDIPEDEITQFISNMTNFQGINQRAEDEIRYKKFSEKLAKLENPLLELYSEDQSQRKMSTETKIGPNGKKVALTKENNISIKHKTTIDYIIHQLTQKGKEDTKEDGNKAALELNSQKLERIFKCVLNGSLDLGGIGNYLIQIDKKRTPKGSILEGDPFEKFVEKELNCQKYDDKDDYVESNDPIIKNKDYKLIDLLHGVKIHFFYNIKKLYKLETKQGDLRHMENFRDTNLKEAAWLMNFGDLPQHKGIKTFLMTKTNQPMKR